MKRILALVILISALFTWNKLTCTACHDDDIESQMFTQITDMPTERSMCMEGKPGFIHRQYTWTNWQVGIYVPGLGCFYNDPTPQYIRIGGFKLTIDTWLKGFHKVEMYSVGF